LLLIAASNIFNNIMLATRIERRRNAVGGRQQELQEELARQKRREKSLKKRIFNEWKALIQETSARKRRFQAQLARKRREEAELREQEMIRLVNKVVFDTWVLRVRRWKKAREERLKRQAFTGWASEDDLDAETMTVGSLESSQGSLQSIGKLASEKYFHWPPRKDSASKHSELRRLHEDYSSSGRLKIREKFSEEIHSNVTNTHSKKRMQVRVNFEHKKEKRMDAKKKNAEYFDKKYKEEIASFNNSCNSLPKESDSSGVNKDSTKEHTSQQSLQKRVRKKKVKGNKEEKNWEEEHRKDLARISGKSVDSDQVCISPIDVSHSSLHRGEPIPRVGSRTVSMSQATEEALHSYGKALFHGPTPAPPSSSSPRKFNGNETKARQQHLRNVYSAATVGPSRKSPLKTGRQLRTATSAIIPATPVQHQPQSPATSGPNQSGPESSPAPSITITKPALNNQNNQKESEELCPEMTAANLPGTSQKKKAMRKRNLLQGVKTKNGKPFLMPVFPGVDNTKASHMQNLLNNSSAVPRLSTAKLRKLRQQHSAQQMMAVYQIFVK